MTTLPEPSDSVKGQIAPSPWEAIPSDPFPWSIRTHHGKEVACVYNHLDAHLIAAAPDMLAALKAIFSYYATIDLAMGGNGLAGPCRLRFWDDARAAIAKAEGRT